MSWGTVNAPPLKWAFAFNDGLECLHRDDTIPPDTDAMGLLIDASDSMKDKQTEVKCLLSAVKCMTNKTNAFNAPVPEKRTRLVDSVNTLLLEPSNVKKVVVITDGHDNASLTKRLIRSIAENGEREMVDMPTYPRRNFAKWLERDRDGERYSVAEFAALSQVEQQALALEHRQLRREGQEARTKAVADHIDALGVQMTIVGVGSEVAPFIAELAKPGRGVRTALISDGASVETVGAVVTAVVRRPPRSRTAPEADETVVAANAEAIDEATVAAIEAEAERTTTAAERRANPDLLIDGAPYDEELQKDYVFSIIDSECSTLVDPDNVPLSDEAKARLAEAASHVIAVFRFLTRLGTGGPVASDLVGGRSFPGRVLASGLVRPRTGALFLVPDGVNLGATKWTNLLGGLIAKLAKNPSAIADKLALPFGNEVQAAIAENKVGPPFHPEGKVASRLCITHELLGHRDLQLRHMYYKFKENTYEHFSSFHRDTSPQPPAPLLTFLNLAGSGNSGPTVWDGPPLPPPPGLMAAEAREAAPSPSLAAGAGSESEASGAEDGEEPPREEVQRLKRKVEVLEEANEQLKAKLQAVAEMVKA